MTAPVWHPWPAEKPAVGGRYRVKMANGKLDLFYWRTSWREGVWTGVTAWMPAVSDNPTVQLDADPFAAEVTP